jgi:hypothetical protein
VAWPWVALTKLHVSRRNAQAAIVAEADRHAANVLPIIREAQKAGATTLRQIAEALNARGVATARGRRWHAKSVSNILGARRGGEHARNHWNALLRPRGHRGGVRSHGTAIVLGGIAAWMINHSA